MDTIKELINKFNPNLKILDISNSFFGSNINKYLDNIINKNNIILIVKNNHINNEYLKLFDNCEIIIFYMDNYINFPKNLDESKVRMMIQRLLNNEKLECCICHQDENKMIPCNTCGVSYCHSCLFEMDKKLESSIKKCCMCNQNSIEYSYEI